MSVGLGKSKGRQTQDFHDQSSIDQATQGYMQQIRDAALAAGNAGPSPLVTGASDYNTALQTAGTLGVNAGSGDAAALSKLMNPYQQQVIDANNANWQHTNAATMQQINDAATRAGAFGGSRQGVATGVALANNNLAQQNQTAGLLSSGYNNAINQANQLTGYGLTGATNNANLGLGGVGSPQAWLMNLLKQGYIGPYGQMSSGYGQQDTSGHNVGGEFTFPFAKK